MALTESEKDALRDIKCHIDTDYTIHKAIALMVFIYTITAYLTIRF